MKAAFIGLAWFLFVGGAVTWFNYSQHFNQDSTNTATSGIYFQTTLNLDEYRNVSQGNDLWGTFSRYTRSDRHSETITVYCNKYCTK